MVGIKKGIKPNRMSRLDASIRSPGNDLLSREVALEVSSALKSLTAVFGMVTGVSSSLLSPEEHRKNLYKFCYFLM